MNVFKGLIRTTAVIAIFALFVQYMPGRIALAEDTDSLTVIPEITDTAATSDAPAFVDADDAPAIAPATTPVPVLEKRVTVKVPKMSEQQKKNDVFIIQLRKHLQNSRNEYFQMSENIKAAKEKLMQVTEAITSLKQQLKNLSNLILNTQDKIRNVEKQIAEKENKIEVLREDIAIKNIELENQKILLKEYLKLLYVQENNFYDSSGEDNISVTKLLLADASLGDTFREIQYYTILEQTGENIFNNIEEIKKAQELNKNQLNLTNVKLSRLNIQLEDEKRNLQIQRNAKEKLLAQTKGEEDIYLELISASKQEQLDLIAEINQLKESLGFIEQKIRQDGVNFNPDNYASLINPNVRAVYDFEMNGAFTDEDTLAWPIKPSGGISAYFQDGSYLATFGIPHNAIDLPIAQGSMVHAPRAGVVYKVKDNGDNSYSYIILAHKGGLLTVYGHMSEVLVKERDVILPGEVIGLSGGIPGTKGSGWLTTGAHLHFEVIKGGKHIDPLLVLPLEELNSDFIPSYLKETGSTTNVEIPVEHE